MTNVAPQSSGLNLGDVVAKYGSRAVVAAFEVTNTIDDHRKKKKSFEVKAAKRFLGGELPRTVVLGGIAFLDNYGTDRVTDSRVDISFHVQDLDPHHYRAAVEAVAAGSTSSPRWTLPNQQERYMVQQILEVSDREGIPLAHFFDSEKPRFWRTIKPFLPWGVGEYIQGMRRARGQIMEEYVGRLLREHLPEGQVLFNYAFRVNAGVRIDIDNLVVAPSIDTLVTSLKVIDGAHKADVRFGEKVYVALKHAA